MTENTLHSVNKSCMLIKVQHCYLSLLQSTPRKAYTVDSLYKHASGTRILLLRLYRRIKPTSVLITKLTLTKTSATGPTNSVLIIIVVGFYKRRLSSESTAA